MNNNYIIKLIMGLLLFLNMSCTQNNTLSSDVFQKEIVFKFSVSNTLTDKNNENAKTRVITDPISGAGYFESGDKVELCISSHTSQIKHFILTYNGTDWSPSLTAEQLGLTENDAVNMVAYFPVRESLNKDVKNLDINLEINQSEKNIYLMQDLLAGFKILNNSEKEVIINLEHKMTRVNVDISKIKRKDIQIRISSRVNGKMSLYTGEIFSENNNEWITPYKQNESVFSAIMFPLSNLIPAGNLRVELTPGTEEPIYYDLPKEEINKCISGGSITIKLSSNESNEEEYANQKIWFNGIDAPLCPETPWKQQLNGNNMKLEYNARYGWFDCNKRYPIDNVTPDNYQCWAAAASNIIHWWFEHNKPYSYEYMQWYNKKAKSEHKDTIPNPHFMPLTKDEKGKLNGGSDIFKYFTNLFPDAGGYTHEGLQWFFCGDEPSKPSHVNLTGKGGFFKDVYKNKQMSYYVGGMSKKHFNNTVKNAIEKGEVIAYSINGHIQNIWGVEFDKEGYVSYVYSVDNNQSDTDAEMYNGASCTRVKIGYKVDPFDQTYIGESGTINIVRLTMMGLHSEELKKFVIKYCRP